MADLQPWQAALVGALALAILYQLIAFLHGLTANVAEKGLIDSRMHLATCQSIPL